MNALIPMYVQASNFFQSRVESLQDRDRGASAVEYVGVIIIAGVIIAGIYAVFSQVDWHKELLGGLKKIFHI